MGAHDNLWGPGQGTRRRTGSRARCRPGHGEESGGADHPLPTGYWRREVRLVVFPRQAARRPRSACSRWREFTSSQRQRRSNLFGFKAAVPRGQLAINAASLLLSPYDLSSRPSRRAASTSDRFARWTDSAVLECEQRQAGPIDPHHPLSVSPSY